MCHSRHRHSVPASPSAKTVGREPTAVFVSRIRHIGPHRRAKSLRRKGRRRRSFVRTRKHARCKTRWAGQRALSIGRISWRENGRRKMHPRFKFARHSNLASRTSPPPTARTITSALWYGGNSVRWSLSSAFPIHSVSEWARNMKRNGEKADGPNSVIRFATIIGRSKSPP